MNECKDEDGIILQYKYIYYTSLNDIADLDYKSNPLTEYALASKSFIILPSGKIFLQGLIRDYDGGINNLTLEVNVKSFSS